MELILSTFRSCLKSYFLHRKNIPHVYIWWYYSESSSIHSWMNSLNWTFANLRTYFWRIINNRNISCWTFTCLHSIKAFVSQHSVRLDAHILGTHQQNHRRVQFSSSFWAWFVAIVHKSLPFDWTRISRLRFPQSLCRLNNSIIILKQLAVFFRISWH
jgi:hypothetical protein